MKKPHAKVARVAKAMDSAVEFHRFPRIPTGLGRTPGGEELNPIAFFATLA